MSSRRGDDYSDLVFWSDEQLQALEVRTRALIERGATRQEASRQAIAELRDQQRGGQQRRRTV